MNMRFTKYNHIKLVEFFLAADPKTMIEQFKEKGLI